VAASVLIADASRPARPLATRSADARALFWLQTLMLVQFGCQLALLFAALAPLRVVWRCTSFGISLALLCLVRGRGPAHPSQRWGWAVLVFLGLGILHPSTNTLGAAVGQWALYLAILGPLFWIPRLDATPAVLRRVLLLFWFFQTSSAALGVLQASFPGQFQPNLSSSVEAMGDRVDGLKVTLANGERIFRPMGLTDMPGGAAPAGMYAVLFGLGLFLTSRGPLRLAAVAGMVIGLFCIYLCQVRSLLVMTGICVLTLALILLWRGQWERLITIAVLIIGVVVVSLVWAVAVGGKGVTDRLATLTEDSAANVYYKNRGGFLEQTVYELLPQYPFGAGLGRWGIMRGYLGDENNPVSEFIYVEIQWTGWLLDGGVPLIVAYSGAVLLACVTACRIALSRLPQEITLAAAVIFAYDIGVFAVTFNYPMFIGQGGLDFWLLNGLLFAAACHASREARRARLATSTDPGSTRP
jgi:hypothetical protein